jgi:hypothetical protein
VRLVVPVLALPVRVDVGVHASTAGQRHSGLKCRENGARINVKDFF